MKTILLTAFSAFSFLLNSQGLKVLEGDLQTLKSQFTIIIKFDYEKMTVGKYNSNQEYIAAMREKLELKEEGLADRWEKGWRNAPADKYEPKFKTLFSEYSDLLVVEDKAKYTLIFHTSHIEPGWDTGFMEAFAFIDGIASIVETNDPSKVVAKISIWDVRGKDIGNEISTRIRIMEAYAKAGKTLGKYIWKNVMR